MISDIFGYDLRRYKARLWLLLIPVVAWAGVRFSDGSMLLAITKEASTDSPIFKVESAQYIWDSPLKIFLLQILPSKIIAIALAFGVLALLPLIGLLVNNQRILWLASASIFLTPSFKVSIQNIGIGDGLIIFMILLIACSKSLCLISSALFLIALWHPQQSFFIGLSYLISKYCYFGELRRRDILVVLGALSVAAIIFMVYKNSLNFSYHSRASYMVHNVGDFFKRNLFFAPVAFAPVALWFLIIGPKCKRSGLLLTLWLFILAIVSLLTTDVTRVISITSLPIVLAGASMMMEAAVPVSFRKLIIIAALVVLIPPYSWSGLDCLLWTDLVNDWCKWIR